MPPYPLYCYSPGCKNLAQYKIAARWSDGVQSELKTFGLVCADCLRDWFSRSVAKHKVYRLTPGESMEPPGIYQLARGERDQKLHRLEELEKQLAN